MEALTAGCTVLFCFCVLEFGDTLFNMDAAVKYSFQLGPFIIHCSKEYFRQTLKWPSDFSFLLFIIYYLQKLYTVCDVAMNIIMSKSTTYSLESPKDPVLPARYFTQPDKVDLGV